MGSSSRVLKGCHPIAGSVEERRHSLHLCACRTEDLKRHLGWGEAGLAKGEEDETAEGAPWVGIVASRNEGGKR